MTRPRLVMMVGLQGSGKSHEARKLVAQDPARWARVNRDSLRAMFHGGWLGTPEQEEQVTAFEEAGAAALLRAGVNVVVDAMNLRPEHRFRWRMFAEQEDAQFEVVDLTQVPLQVCLERNAEREGDEKVPEKKIRDAHAMWILQFCGRPVIDFEPWLGQP
jgi:predicted kinase